MPTDGVSLLLYVGLLLPGFAFALARSGHRPLASRSAFRETTSALFVSVICDGTLLTLILLWTLVEPASRRFADESLQNLPAAFSAAPVTWTLAGFAFLVVATAIGWILGTEWTHRLVLTATGHREGAGSS